MNDFNRDEPSPNSLVFQEKIHDRIASNDEIEEFQSFSEENLEFLTEDPVYCLRQSTLFLVRISGLAGSDQDRFSAGGIVASYNTLNDFESKEIVQIGKLPFNSHLIVDFIWQITRARCVKSL